MHRKNYFFKIVISLFLVIVFSTTVFSTVEVFSNYDTVLNIEDNFITINKTLTLKNVYDVGIVPGQIEFKIAKGEDGSVNDLKVINVSSKDQFGKDIKTQVREIGDYTVIILDIYYPLLPGFEYKFTLNYKLSYKPGGLFYKSLNIPLRESTIPIKSGKFEVILPKSYRFTYFGTNEESRTVEKNIAKWDIKDNMPNSIVFEYSWIGNPFRESFKGSYIFWGTINLLLLLLLFFEIKKEIKRVRQENETS